MSTVKLISEEMQDVEYITEEKEDGKKNYKIKGIFLIKKIKLRFIRFNYFYIFSRG